MYPYTGKLRKSFDPYKEESLFSGITFIPVTTKDDSDTFSDTESIQLDWEIPFGVLVDEGRTDAQLEMLADKLDIERALNCISPREAAAIRLRFLLCLKQSAIANLLGVSAATKSP